jgi:hypothetical protein
MAFLAEFHHLSGEFFAFVTGVANCFLARDIGAFRAVSRLGVMAGLALEPGLMFSVGEGNISHSLYVSHGKCFRADIFGKRCSCGDHGESKHDGAGQGNGQELL